MITRLRHARLRHLPLAAAILLAASGCAARREVAPIRAQDLGAGFTPAARASAGSALFPACGASAEAQAAQTVVSGWFDVVSHIDTCDLSAARYYSGPATEADIAARLAALGETGDATCRAEVRAVRARIRSTNSRIAAWIPDAVPICSLSVHRETAAAQREEARRRTREMRCQIARSFPELGGERCSH